MALTSDGAALVGLESPRYCPNTKQRNAEDPASKLKAKQSPESDSK